MAEVVKDAGEEAKGSGAPDDPDRPDPAPPDDTPSTGDNGSGPSEAEPRGWQNLRAKIWPGRKSGTKTSLKHRLLEIPVLVALAFLIAVVIKTFLVQAFYIPSGSMFPTLHVGDRVLVEKVSDLWTGPRKGDIVVFERDVFGPPPESRPWHEDARNFFRDLLGLPTGGTEDYIKRVVAVGGDTLRYTGSPRLLVVNGEPVEEPYINRGTDEGSPSLTKKDCDRLGMDVAENSCRVPAGMVFVMGDNRANSEDSRIIGPVDESKIVGKAFMILWPPDSIGTL